jgi:hypothetical protein
VAVSVTAVEPSGNVLPEAGAAVTATGPSTRSEPSEENVTAAPAAEVASAVKSAGRSVAAGALVSAMPSKSICWVARLVRTMRSDWPRFGSPAVGV